MGYLYNLEEAPARRVRRDVRGLLRTSLLLPRTRGTDCKVLTIRKYADLLASLFWYANLVWRYGWYWLIKIGEERDEFQIFICTAFFHFFIRYFINRVLKFNQNLNLKHNNLLSTYFIFYFESLERRPHHHHKHKNKIPRFICISQKGPYLRSFDNIIKVIESFIRVRACAQYLGSFISFHSFRRINVMNIIGSDDTMLRRRGASQPWGSTLRHQYEDSNCVIKTI